MTRTWRLVLLRLGIIFTATGIVVLAVLGRHGRLPVWAALTVGIVLVVLGLPMLFAGTHKGFAGK